MNKISKIFISIGILFCLCTCFIACDNDDNYKYPSAKLEFLTIQTSSSGEFNYATTDDDETYSIIQDDTSSKVGKDSILRVIAYYSVESDGSSKGVHIYSASKTISPIPLATNKFKDGIKTDPADLISIWKGNGYLNIILGIKMSTKTHLFHFIEQENTVDAVTQTRHIALQLYHDEADDTRAYTSRIYLSVPLKQYFTNDVQHLDVNFTLTDYDGVKHEEKFDY